ncbi:nitrile hydratase accessory protein [Teichococcus deserti]|uniref:nitrile hydratase accessory protein n=1 Tax=Teichococcus deserti TaxID=1817963 RepID=UPI001F621B4F|nr:nitrile hydratase accessory protein [Pseudoroseomonas deserti]
MAACDTPRDLPGLPQDADGPVFAAPWEAQAFALTLALHEAGCFAWSEWADCLGAEIASAERPYYEHWLAALERIVAEKRIVAPAALEERRLAWAAAAARTPHGQPITL